MTKPAKGRDQTAGCSTLLARVGAPRLGRPALLRTIALTDGLRWLGLGRVLAHGWAGPRRRPSGSCVKRDVVRRKRQSCAPLAVQETATPRFLY